MPDAEENCQLFKISLFLTNHGLKTMINIKKVNTEILKGRKNEPLNSKIKTKNIKINIKNNEIGLIKAVMAKRKEAQ